MDTRIIDRGRGPEIRGTRVTVYRIMDFVCEGSAPDRIAGELNLTGEQVQAALDYIDAHREAVEREYQAILRRVQQRNPPHVEAGRAESVEELKQRIRARRREDVTHVDAGR